MRPRESSLTASRDPAGSVAPASRVQWSPVSHPWLQVTFGIVVGEVARIAVPGQHTPGLLSISILSLLGACAGECVARILFPRDLLQTGGYVLSGLGALATLLAYGAVTL